jgi:hypothetical protein
MAVADRKRRIGVGSLHCKDMTLMPSFCSLVPLLTRYLLVL